MKRKENTIYGRLVITESVIAVLISWCIIFCILWRIEIREKKKIEIEKGKIEMKLKNSENIKQFWADKAIELDSMLREKLKVGLSDNRPIDFEAKLDEKLQNCK